MTLALAGTWLRHAIQPEDVLLAAILVASPLLRPRGTSSGILDREPDLVGGLIALVAAVGAIACLATRVPGASALDSAGRTAGPRRMVDFEARYAFVGPLLGGIALVADTGARKLGFDFGGALIGIAFIVSVMAFAFAERLPVVRPELRRALVTPFVLVCGGIFQRFVASLTDGLDLPALVRGADAWSAAAGLGAMVGIGALIVLGAAVFYAMLVYAPRELAEGGTEGRSWIVRFAFFIVFTGVGLLLRPTSG